MRIAWVLVLFGVMTSALAQEPLKINQPAERQLASGSVQSYALELKAAMCALVESSTCNIFH